MKTSLNIDDFLFNEAKKEAAASKRSVSEVLSLWANKGREALKKGKKKKNFKPLNLGIPEVDLSCRKIWMDDIE